MIKLYSCSACNIRFCRVVISTNELLIEDMGGDDEAYWSGPPVECVSGKRSMKPRWREC